MDIGARRFVPERVSGLAAAAKSNISSFRELERAAMIEHFVNVWRGWQTLLLPLTATPHGPFGSHTPLHVY